MLMIVTNLIGSAMHGVIFNTIALILSTIAILVVSRAQMAAAAVARALAGCCGEDLSTTLALLVWRFALGTHYSEGIAGVEAGRRGRGWLA